MFVIWSWSESRVRFRASKTGLSPAHRFKPRPPSNFSPATVLCSLSMYSYVAFVLSLFLISAAFCCLRKAKLCDYVIFWVSAYILVLISTTVILSALYKNILLEANPSGHMTSIQSRVNVNVDAMLYKRQVPSGMLLTGQALFFKCRYNNYRFKL